MSLLMSHLSISPELPVIGCWCTLHGGDGWKKHKKEGMERYGSEKAGRNESAFLPPHQLLTPGKTCVTFPYSSRMSNPKRVWSGTLWTRDEELYLKRKVAKKLWGSCWLRHLCGSTLSGGCQLWYVPSRPSRFCKLCVFMCVCFCVHLCVDGEASLIMAGATGRLSDQMGLSCQLWES